MALASDPAERKTPKFAPWSSSLEYSETSALRVGDVRPMENAISANPPKNSPISTVIAIAKKAVTPKANPAIARRFSPTG